MNYQFMKGDALEIAKTLPDNNVHCIVTSPPY
jgi:DNA modification methylase